PATPARNEAANPSGDPVSTEQLQPAITPPAAGASPRRPACGLMATGAAQVVVTVILAQTLFFKFTYAPETRYIFESRGGRPAATVVGLVELVCVVLLLLPRAARLGALLALAVIGLAIVTHLTSLGIEVK